MLCVPLVSMTVLQALYRSRSAPREEAAARRHVERMNGSPTRAAAVAASRESILDSQQQQMFGSFQKEQLRQSGGNIRGSAAFASPSAKKVCWHVEILSDSVSLLAGPLLMHQGCICWRWL